MKRLLESTNLMEKDENQISKIQKIEEIKLNNSSSSNNNNKTDSSKMNNSSKINNNLISNSNSDLNCSNNNGTIENVGPALQNSSSHRPDAKTQRYDRQLRLWEKSGQNKLENSTITISPSNSTSSQILKNLILPGLGSFRLFDSRKVSRSDLGNDFFLNIENSHRSNYDGRESFELNRAREVSKNLIELNPDVKPLVFEEDLVDLNNKEDEDWFRRKVERSCLVIGVRMREEEELKLAEECWKNDLPLILVQSFGFMATVRVQFQELGIIETHPDSLVDLRLDCPFPSLIEFVNSFNFKQLNNHDHSHIPSVVILIYFLNVFKSNNSNRLPSNSKEKGELKKMILSEKRNSDEENFDEAISMISKACRPTKIPPAIQSLFNDPKCENLNRSSSSFWILIKALKSFVIQQKGKDDGTSLLPLTGILPDLRSDSKNYVNLLKLYKKKSEEDLMEFKRILKDLLMRKDLLGSEISFSLEDGEENDDLIRSFVKNSSHLRMIRGKSLIEERDQLINMIKRLKEEMESNKSREEEEREDQSGISIYLSSRILSIFREKNGGRYPGQTTRTDKDQNDDGISTNGHSLENHSRVRSVNVDDEDADYKEVKEILIDYLYRFRFFDDYDDDGIKKVDEGLSSVEIDRRFESLPKFIKDSLKEMVRSGGTELPQIASLIGGIVSQESIKLISNQYLPLNGTLIFDGIKSTTRVIS